MAAMRRRPRPPTPASLNNAALHYLERFASSSENLRRVLMRRVERAARAGAGELEAGAPMVDELVARLLASGLLDDRVYAEGRARSLHRRGNSRRAIRAKLRRKGVGDDHIEAALAGLVPEVGDEDGDEDGVDLAAARALARRRRLGPWGDGTRRQRDLAALARAGFAFDVARRVVDGTEGETP